MESKLAKFHEAGDLTNCGILFVNIFDIPLFRNIQDLEIQLLLFKQKCSTGVSQAPSFSFSNGIQNAHVDNFQFFDLYLNLIAEIRSEFLLLLQDGIFIFCKKFKSYF